MRKASTSAPMHRDCSPKARLFPDRPGALIEVRNHKDKLVLDLFEEEKALVPGEIARRLDIPRSMITRRIADLYRQGLVECLRDPK